MNRRAFTLIELLIVVAIIAILAAIAVPNFLEAQTRSKVSRVRSDLRTMATALESYVIDWNRYPADVPMTRRTTPVTGEFVTSDSYFPNTLSTPIAYVTVSRLPDPFVKAGQAGIGAATPLEQEYYKTLFYQNVDLSIRAALGESLRAYSTQPAPAAPGYNSIKSGGGWGLPVWREVYGHWKIGSLGPSQTYDGGFNAYDPTNGTISEGDIYRTSVKAEGNRLN